MSRSKCEFRRCRVAGIRDGNGDDKLFTFLADAKGGFGTPFSSFARTDADGWEVDRMKFATGDYNGDGRDDIGVLDSYTAGTVRLMTFTAAPGGGFGEPVRGWESTGWQFGRVSVHSGDFDGNGRDEFAASADQLKGRTIDHGPYAGETVYTFREWLESAKKQNMAAFVELKGEAGQSLLNTNATIRETAWREVIDPIAERASTQKIMIYTGAKNTGLKAELIKRIEAAGLGATLKNYPRWVDSAAVGWEEPAPPASDQYATWQEKLDQFGTPVSSQAMVTTWPKELKSWLSGKCL
ncbi:FG-GAP repeat domain-containing protein [Streptomyces sp. NPDC058377]|uniref:FG-GAP repeat domain-containing protein n=1 Tax=Streptomyces sp. NPDC058377 TaxID=3346468 RepID=UPI0036466540